MCFINNNSILIPATQGQGDRRVLWLNTRVLEPDKRGFEVQLYKLTTDVTLGKLLNLLNLYFLHLLNGNSNSIYFTGLLED